MAYMRKNYPWYISLEITKSHGISQLSVRKSRNHLCSSILESRPQCDLISSFAHQMVNIFMDHMISPVGDYIIELREVVTLYIIFYETYEIKRNFWYVMKEQNI